MFLFVNPARYDTHVDADVFQTGVNDQNVYAS